MGSDVTSDFQSFDIFVFQSTPPHGERQGLTSLIPLQRHILKAHRKQAVKFQSTLPAWGATPVRFPALRQFPYFNPRSSHGERRIRRWNRDLFQGFQSTPPHGERPNRSRIFDERASFQSTPPAWGATRIKSKKRFTTQNFNPRPPHGERQRLRKLTATTVIFQSTLPHGERRSSNMVLL